MNKYKWLFVFVLCVLMLCIRSDTKIANAAVAVEEIAEQWKSGKLVQRVGQPVVFEGCLWSVHYSERFGPYIVMGPSKLTFTDYIVCGFEAGEMPKMIPSEKEQRLVVRGRLTQREAPEGGLFYMDHCQVIEVLDTKTKPQKTLLLELLKE